MEILLTGGAGYIGSHVLKRLLEAEHDTVTIDNLKKGLKKAVLDGKFIEGDIGNKELLQSIYTEYDIKGVVQLQQFMVNQKQFRLWKTILQILKMFMGKANYFLKRS